MITKNDKILITGCGGMVGNAVYERFKNRAVIIPTDLNPRESRTHKLDVSSQKEVEGFCAAHEPNYIIHLAALTDLEYCEKNPAHAYAVNSEGTKHLTLWAKKNNIPFVYISTAGIFDGKKEFYTEENTPNPINVYGKSKYQGELAVRSLPKFIVIRAGWMMGGGPQNDKKFVNKIIAQLKNGACELTIVNDKSGTPTYTYDLARIIESLLDNNHFGVFHGTCKGSGTRLEIAQYILNFFGLSDTVVIKEVDSSYFKNDYSAPRPASEQLINTKLATVNADFTRDWRVCLSEYLSQFDWGIKY